MLTSYLLIILSGFRLTSALQKLLWPLQRYGTVIEEVSADILFGTCGSSCADVTDVSSPGCSQVPFLPVCRWIFDSAIVSVGCGAYLAG